MGWKSPLQQNDFRQGSFMVSNGNRVEKRKHDRFKAQKETYVALMNDSVKVGQIINISRDGLAFSYIANGPEITGWHNMSIFLSSSYFYLKDLRFKAISDFLIENNVQFSTVFMKQCGGQFGELTPTQITQLEYFIANHTVS